MKYSIKEKGYIKKIIAIVFMLMLCACTKVPQNKNEEPAVQQQVQESVQPNSESSEIPTEEKTEVLKQSQKKENDAEKKETDAVKNKTEKKETSAGGQSTAQVSYSTISVFSEAEQGFLMAPISVEINEGETVLDFLLKVARSNKLSVEYSGRGQTAYVEGIGGLYEFDHGPTSGWIYKVNSVAVSKSAGTQTLNNNDRVEWIYTLDFTAKEKD